MLFLVKMMKVRACVDHFHLGKGLKEMFELNDQEIAQVAGGQSHGHQYTSHSSTKGNGSADLGAVESYSFTDSQVNARGAKSRGWNDTLAIGVNPAASSSSDTESN